MCGIFLFFDEPKYTNENLINDIFNDIKRRGPDDSNLLHLDNLTIGHSRLTLVDLGEGGRQPKQDKNERYFLSFNGEIYNWVELAKKYNLNSCSGDTDLLFKLLINYSCQKILTEIDGPFAIIFYDKKKDELILARDQFGEKPLYYYEDTHKKIVCSSNKFRFNLEKYSSDKVKNYFQNLNSRGFYLPDGIRSIKPGSIEVYKNFSVSRSYQKSLITSKSYKSSNLYEILMNSLKVRSRLDVDFCVFLSGGVDSTLTTAMLCDLGFKPKCFTIANNKEDIEYKESEKISKKFNLDLELINLKKDLISYFEYYDSQFSPLADTAGYPLYCGTKHISKNFKCAFVGDGADEAFMGYPRYQFSFLLEKFNFKILRNLFEISKLKFFDRQELKKIDNSLEFLSMSISRNKSERALLNNFQQEKNSSLLKIMRDFDRKERLPDYLMLKSDNNSMCNGVELRSMFLNKELFSFSEELSFFDNWKYGFINKKPLRDLLKDKYSIKIKNKKQGFFVDHLKQLQSLMDIVINTSNNYPLINKFLNELIQSKNFKNNIMNINCLLVTVFTALPKSFKDEIYYNLQKY